MDCIDVFAISVFKMFAYNIMFFGRRKFSEGERRMKRDEFIKGISYYTEENVIKNKSNSLELLNALPITKNKKIEEALSIFELTPKEDEGAIALGTD
jgi:hypothetical protein